LEPWERNNLATAPEAAVVLERFRKELDAMVPATNGVRRATAGQRTKS
jgi:hypothetical protein